VEGGRHLPLPSPRQQALDNDLVNQAFFERMMTVDLTNRCEEESEYGCRMGDDDLNSPVVALRRTAERS
jgi:hypothetical protein